MVVQGRHETALVDVEVRFDESLLDLAAGFGVQQGDLEIRTDDEWRRQMSPVRRCIVTAMTCDLLSKYGYR